MSTFFDKQKELWPDKCPECGYMAYIGMNEVKCITVRSCKNYSAKEEERFVELEKEYESERDTLPDVDSVAAVLDEYIKNVPVATWKVGSTSFDWRDHVLNTIPLNPTAPNNWEYQLPAGESKKVYIGDRLADHNGRMFRVSRIDRSTDKITIVSWP